MELFNIDIRTLTLMAVRRVEAEFDMKKISNQFPTYMSNKQKRKSSSILRSWNLSWQKLSND